MQKKKKKKKGGDGDGAPGDGDGDGDGDGSSDGDGDGPDDGSSSELSCNQTHLYNVSHSFLRDDYAFLEDGVVCPPPPVGIGSLILGIILTLCGVARRVQIVPAAGAAAEAGTGPPALSSAHACAAAHAGLLSRPVDDDPALRAGAPEGHHPLLRDGAQEG